MTSGKKMGNGADDARANGSARASADALLPSTNRGVTMTIDYLSLTFHTNVSRIAFLAVSHLLGYEIPEASNWSDFFYKREGKARGYQAMYSGEHGMMLYAFPSDQSQHCHLELKGQALAAIGYEALCSFLAEVDACGFRWKATRIDIAFDHHFFTPQMCWDAYQKGKFRTRANRDSGDWRENNKGKTFYIGSRMSPRFLRIYDKRGPSRIEMVYKKEYAEALRQQLTNIEELKNTALGFLRSYIEFTEEPVQGKNSSRAKTANWWHQLVNDVEPTTIKKGAVREDHYRQSLERYYERLLPTLCIFSEGLGKDLNNEVKRRLQSLEWKHIAKIKKLKS